MNYIIFDLEWNQSPNGKEQVNKELPFEIIEIGAVRLNENFKETGRFHEIIAPKIYKELHWATKDLIMLTMEELKKGRSFEAVAKEFLEWCGKDGEFIFCTWGNMDLVELQRNCRFYKVDYEFPRPFIFYDVQKLYSRCFLDGKKTVALENATNERGIEKTIPFHSAFADAWYTSLVFKTLDFDRVKRFTSIDTFVIPKSTKEEFTINYGEYTKYISKGFADTDEAMQYGRLLTSICPICNKPIRKKIRWFAASHKKYYSLSYCNEHGYIKGKIRIRKTDNDEYFGMKIMKPATDEAIALIKQRQLLERQKRRNRRIREKNLRS